MSQSDFGNMESPLSGSDFINNKLEPFRDALHTMHSGTSRPIYAVPGLMWLDTASTPWIVKVFDGTDDITIGTINATTNKFVANGALLSGISDISTFMKTVLDDADAASARATLGISLDFHGQCILLKSGSNVLLRPFNGNKLIINGAAYAIPSSGISLAPTSLTPSTLYYVYAYMNSSTMTLEASTTGHTTDSTTGVEIKSGDATRTLVGMVRPITGPAFADTETQRFVRSWFNSGSIHCLNPVTSSTLNSNTTYSETSAAYRVEWLSWANEISSPRIDGSIVGSNVAQTIAASIGIDSTTVSEDAWAPVVTVANILLQGPISVGVDRVLSEGYHYATILVKASGGTVAVLGSGTAGTRSVIRARIGRGN